MAGRGEAGFVKPPRRIRLEFLWLVVLALAAGLSWVPARLVRQQSLALERQVLDRDINRMVHGLRNEILALDALARDWGRWDDSYRFVQDRNPGFSQANLSWESLITSTRIHLLLIADVDGRTVWSGFRTTVHHPSEFPAALAGGQPLPSTAGILLTPEGPLLIAVQPILKSDGSGASRGTLVMGRLLDEAVLLKIRQAESLNFQARDTLRNAFGSEETARLARLGSGYEVDFGPNEARAHALLPNLSGGGGLWLTLNWPRDIYLQGQKASWTVGGAIFLAFLTVGSALVFGLRWFHLAMTRDMEMLRGLVETRTLELQEANRALEEASMVDALTGLRNRRFVDFSLPNDVARSLRIFRDTGPRAAVPDGLGEDMVFFLVDLDHFKQVNDLHGHLAGDAVLREVGALLRKICRESDLVARWGGEEFLVVARRTNREYASVIAEHLVGAFRQHAFLLPNGVSLQATCSVGYCPFPVIPRLPDAVPWARVMEMADLCLYAAKKSGRNGWVGVTVPEAGNAEVMAARLPGGFLDLVKAGLLEIRTSFPDPIKLTW